jgi:hypothetical protein
MLHGFEFVISALEVRILVDLVDVGEVGYDEFVACDQILVLFFR